MNDAPGSIFLLSQLGSAAARRFAERVSALGLTAQQARMLRGIGRHPRLSQQQLADRLGILPSKVVLSLNELETQGLVRRTRPAQDRRIYELTLTRRGATVLGQVQEIAAEHERDFFRPLSRPQRAELLGMLRQLAEAHRLPAEWQPEPRTPR